MLADAAAKPYAIALLELATAQKKTDAFARELESFTALFQQSEDLRIVLTNPAIPLPQRHTVLDTVLQRVKLEPMLRNFLHLLIDRGRIGILPAIHRAFRAASDEAAGRVRGTAVATVPLNAMQLNRLAGAVSKLVGQEVVLEARQDESLIGGLRVEVAGRVFDGSVRGQLERIREQLRA